MLYIIDASVALKWFIQEENGQKEAEKVLSDLIENPNQYAIPELFMNEIFSLFCRIYSSSAEVLASLQKLEDLGLPRIPQGKEVFETAALLSGRYRLSGYDAIYAATAQLLGAVWITADAKAHHKLEALKISALLC